MMDWVQAKGRLERLLAPPDESTRTAQRTALLRERARRLALSGDHGTSVSSDRMFVVFRIGEERFGVALPEIESVIAKKKPSLVPGAPAFVAGIVEVRGEVIPVFRLEQVLGSGGNPDVNELIVLLRAGNRAIGLTVQEVEDVRELREEDERVLSGEQDHTIFLGETPVTMLNTTLLLKQLSEKEN